MNPGRIHQPPPRSRASKTSKPVEAERPKADKPKAGGPSVPPAPPKPLAKDEIQGLRGRAKTQVGDSTSLFSTQLREKGGKGARAVKASHSRHLRKDIRAMKAEGVHPWETGFGHRVRAASDPTPPSSVDPASGPAKARVAATFTAILKDLGFHAYVSGGAALAWHGGGRPIDDLDFRIARGTHGIGNFEDPQGQALLAALNDARLALTAEGFQVAEFRPLGGGGLTIVCDDFCGAEVSISLTAKEQGTERLRPELADAGELTAQPGAGADKAMRASETDVHALTLPELQADKLKSTISRWKWGGDNIKKTSQDLYDLLDAIVLEDGPSLKAAVERAVDARVDDYRASNFAGVRLDHVSSSSVKKEMMAYAVLIAKEHTHGDRKQAFNKLCAADPVAGAKVKALLAKLVALPVDPQALSAIRPEIAEWRDREGPSGRRMPVDMPPIHRLPGVEDIMAKGVFESGLTAQGVANGHIDQVLTVLIAGDGFRPLDDSKNGFQTQLAFGLSPNQFSKVYRALNKEGLVSGERDGLHLTAKGRGFCDLD
ncbi:MAG: nucleotidyl transferase AbiEii/AbiGii toxin family protein [Myxococcales bacterium]|nr:nucleotidyl transferase AbiEii/AbiGii toxin family protein [Myxococcales bacterium]